MEHEADEPAGSTAPTVIFAPVLADVTSERTKRYYGQLALLDYGDHIEWNDTRRIDRWRLPDQPPDPELPELHAVLLAGFATNYLTRRVVFYRVRFLGPDAHVIGWFGASANTELECAERILPDSASAELRSHGVQLIYETITTGEREFYDAYPDPRVAGAWLAFARRPFLWTAVFVALILIVVNIVLVLNGYYD